MNLWIYLQYLTCKLQSSNAECWKQHYDDNEENHSKTIWRNYHRNSYLSVPVSSYLTRIQQQLHVWTEQMRFACSCGRAAVKALSALCWRGGDLLACVSILMIQDKARGLSHFNNSVWTMEQDEGKRLMLPKAQLRNMLTSPTPDLTLTETHGIHFKHHHSYFHPTLKC